MGIAAFYLRLSKADGEAEESNSICSQRELLQQSLSRYGLFPETVVEYVDDGYSGKNFDRPGIIRLFQDLEQGHIQTILVKDFSRFGRNYKKVSEYLEKKFPKAGVRFIAVNNHYDSDKQGDNTSAIFQSVFDDYYSEENSQKIRLALSQLKKEGKYMVPVAPYGYKIDPEQPYHLIPDPEAAQIVKLIFQMRWEGKSGGEIARFLNGANILSPYDYKNGKKRAHIWQSEVIWKIVRNRVYLGNLVAGKYHTVQTGSRKRKMAPPEQWIEVEAVHKALIDQEIFEQAQITERAIQEKEQNVLSQEEKTGKKAKKKTEEKIETKSTSYLRGLLTCSGCGHKMKRKGAKHPFFFCKYYYYNLNPLCLKKGIKEEKILYLIRTILVEKMGGMDGEHIYRQYKERYQKIRKQQERKEKKLQKQRELKVYFLYEKWKAGGISGEDYQRGVELYKRQVDYSEGNREGDIKGNIGGQIKWGGDKKRLREVEYAEFSEELLKELIAGIGINSMGRIGIRFRFRDIEQKKDIGYE